MLWNTMPPQFVFSDARMQQELLDGKTVRADETVSETGWSRSAV